MPPDRPATAQAPADVAVLVETVRSGDPAAFEAFYRRYETAVYRTALALVRDVSTAEEIVVDTFVRAHRTCARLDPERSPLPWLQRIAINLAHTALCRRHLRLTRIPNPEQAPWPDPAAPSPALAVEQRETSAALARSIGRLPAPMRLVVVLRYVEELSLGEIAEALDCPTGTVKSRLFYGLRRLRDDLRAEPLAPVTAPERATRSDLRWIPEPRGFSYQRQRPRSRPGRVAWWEPRARAQFGQPRSCSERRWFRRWKPVRGRTTPGAGSARAPKTGRSRARAPVLILATLGAADRASQGLSRQCQGEGLSVLPAVYSCCWPSWSLTRSSWLPSRLYLRSHPMRLRPDWPSSAPKSSSSAGVG